MKKYFIFAIAVLWITFFVKSPVFACVTVPGGHGCYSCASYGEEGNQPSDFTLDWYDEPNTHACNATYTVSNKCMQSEIVGFCNEATDYSAFFNGSWYGWFSNSVTADEVVSTETRIIDFTPANGTTTPSGVPVDFSLHAYINPSDVGSWYSVKLTLHNIDQNVLFLSFLSPNDIYFFEGNATTSGSFYFASSTILADGNYRIEAVMQKSYLNGIIVNPFVIADESHQFTVGTSTFIGNISQNSFTDTQEIFGNSEATSTANLAKTCVPWSGTFDTLSCLAFLFVPDGKGLYDTVKSFKDNVSTHFPLGYVTDFINILSTTTVSTIPVVNATLPEGVPGTGANIQLALSSSTVNWLWNSTVGDFANSSAPDTRSLFLIVSDYWNKIVYILTGLYIIRRILGHRAIPEIDVNKTVVKKYEEKY